jgi:hypothetical protein
MNREYSARDCFGAARLAMTTMMDEHGMTDRTLRSITQRLSLRPPQARSLEILADVSQQRIPRSGISNAIFPRCALRWRPASARRG